MPKFSFVCWPADLLFFFADAVVGFSVAAAAGGGFALASPMAMALNAATFCLSASVISATNAAWKSALQEALPPPRALTPPVDFFDEAAAVDAVPDFFDRLAVFVDAPAAAAAAPLVLRPPLVFFFDAAAGAAALVGVDVASLIDFFFCDAAAAAAGGSLRLADTATLFDDDGTTGELDMAAVPSSSGYTGGMSSSLLSFEGGSPQPADASESPRFPPPNPNPPPKETVGVVVDGPGTWVDCRMAAKERVVEWTRDGPRVSWTRGFSFCFVVEVADEDAAVALALAPPALSCCEVIISCRADWNPMALEMNSPEETCANGFTACRSESACCCWKSMRSGTRVRPLPVPAVDAVVVVVAIGADAEVGLANRRLFRMTSNSSVVAACSAVAFAFAAASSAVLRRALVFPTVFKSDVRQQQSGTVTADSRL